MEQPITSAPIIQEAAPRQQLVPLTPVRARGNTMLIALVVILIVILAGGGLYVWNALQPSFVENTEEQPIQQARTETAAPDEVSGLETDLTAIDIGSDAELTELENQL